MLSKKGEACLKYVWFNVPDKFRCWQAIQCKKWEAPLLKDDFYLNLVDWSDNDNIGVGLDTSLCVRSGCFSKVTRIY